MIEKPKCECFENGDDTGRVNAILVAQRMSMHLVREMASAGLCGKAAAYVFEHAIINMASLVAISGTIIEENSVEHEWETDRVLTGIEARVRGRVKELYVMLRGENKVEVQQ